MSKQPTNCWCTRLRLCSKQCSPRTPPNTHRDPQFAANPRRHRGSPLVPPGYILGTRTARRSTSSLRSRIPRQTPSTRRYSSRTPTRRRVDVSNVGVIVLRSYESWRRRLVHIFARQRPIAANSGVYARAARIGKRLRNRRRTRCTNAANPRVDFGAHRLGLFRAALDLAGFLRALLKRHASSGRMLFRRRRLFRSRGFVLFRLFSDGVRRLGDRNRYRWRGRRSCRCRILRRTACRQRSNEGQKKSKREVFHGKHDSRTHVRCEPFASSLFRPSHQHHGIVAPCLVPDRTRPCSSPEGALYKANYRVRRCLLRACHPRATTKPTRSPIARRVTSCTSSGRRCRGQRSS